MRARRRVIGTRFSMRPPLDSDRLGCDNGAFAAATRFNVSAASSQRLQQVASLICFNTSSLVIRPPLPVPVMLAASRCFSSINLRAAGATFAPLSALRLAAAADCLRGNLRRTAPACICPSFKRPINSPLSTVSPSPFRISASVPSAGATTSSTTLSVSISNNQFIARDRFARLFVPGRDGAVGNGLGKCRRFNLNAHAVVLKIRL